MCEPNRRAKHRDGQSFKQSLDALRTTPGRRSPGPFSRDRGGSTCIHMVVVGGTLLRPYLRRRLAELSGAHINVHLFTPAELGLHLAEPRL